MRKRRLLARGSTGALAGMAAGLVAGIGARVAMRMVADGVADGVGVTPQFTIAGSILIAIFGAMLGAGGGLLYEAIADRLPGPAPAHGVIFGAVLLLLIGPVFFLGNEEFFSIGRVALFAILFVIFGVALGFAHSPSDRLASALPFGLQALLLVVALASVSLLAVGITGLVLQSNSAGSM